MRAARSTLTPGRAVGRKFGGPLLVPGQAHQLGVDTQSFRLDIQVVQSFADEYVLPQRHRSVLLDDHFGVTSDSPQPITELLRIAHRRGERSDPNRPWQMQNHLFPHRAAKSIGEVVHLVHDDVGQSDKRRGICVEHVAQHFGRHHDDWCFAVDRVVAGKKTNAVLAVPICEIVKLLVGKGLDRRRVETLPATLDS
jgi:hypothetical protein